MSYKLKPATGPVSLGEVYTMPSNFLKKGVVGLLVMGTGFKFGKIIGSPSKMVTKF
jgi:hypothetical protein